MQSFLDVFQIYYQSQSATNIQLSTVLNLNLGFAERTKLLNEAKYKAVNQKHCG